MNCNLRIILNECWLDSVLEVHSVDSVCYYSVVVVH